MGGKRKSMIEKILHRAGARIEEWRRQDQARQAEAEADRDKLWAEAKEREELLADGAREAESFRGSVEVLTDRPRFVFVVLSDEEARTLENFASERSRLVKVVPVKTSRKATQVSKARGSSSRSLSESACAGSYALASGHYSPSKEFSQMNSFPNKILLATDGSEDADLAARAAIELSNRTASELHVVHVGHDVPTAHFQSYVRAQLRQEAEEVLQKQIERIEQSGGTIAEAHLREGRTVDEILDLSEELEVGLLIVGSRGLGRVKRTLLGSISEGIVHHSRRPVLVMRGGPAWLAGTQSLSTSDTVLAAGASLGNTPSAQTLTSSAPESNIHTA